MRLEILGPLRVRRDGTEVDPGPRQRALLLAVLLARAGQPVSVSELVDVIWGDGAPPSAVNVIQKHVGSLRRLLEPDLPYRDGGSYLRLHGNGYLFAAERDVVDLVAFRALAGEAAGERDREASLDRYDEALRLWRGPAGGAFGGTSGGGPAATRVFAELDEEFFAACVAAAALAISLGRPRRVLQPLRLAASMAPLHEPVQASLISALAASGQRAEALSLLAEVQARLAGELSIDPGPTLRAVRQQLLERSPVTAAGLVGRDEELAVLLRGLDQAVGGRTGPAVVEGEPGAGKTRLLEELAAEARRRGAYVVWGHCLEGDGTPAMWPWMETVHAILDDLPVEARERWAGGELGRLVAADDAALHAVLRPDNGLRFRLFERMAEMIAFAAARRPVVLVIDDLQWADVASLDLFGHLGAHLPPGVVLLGAFRTHAPVPGSQLTRMLAGVSRLAGHRRVHLGPLGQDEVTELVRHVTGRTPDLGVSRGIRARAGGNPFFVRELSRLLLTGGDALAGAESGAESGAEAGSEAGAEAVRDGVPATVRDVVQDRMAGLDDTTRALLRIAALIGREADVGLLAHVAELDVATCLRHLEPVEELGLIGPAPGNPFSVRFAHDLVRDSVARSTPSRSALRLHLRVADAIERIDPAGESIAERLAYHLWAAGPLADPARTASALLRAGRRAAVKSAFEAAGRHLRSAARVARTAGLAETELAALSQLTMVLGMRGGYVVAPADVLERSEELARGLGRELEATSFLFTRWTSHSQGVQIAASGRLARRLRDQGEASADSVVRVYGRLAWGVHQWETGEIGEALRYLTMTARAASHGAAPRADAPMVRDLGLLSAGMLGLVTTLHGDVPAARAQFAETYAVAVGDPYAITFWATFASLSATVAGDPQWALSAAERGIADDPDLTFAFLGTYQRLARWWARGMLGHDRAGAAAELERLIAGNLVDPPRSCLATWSAALAEVHLAAGSLDAAEAALARAEEALERYGQRYAEGLVLTLRARLAVERGDPDEAVRAAVERARSLSGERGAHLFARRAEDPDHFRSLHS